ncbi:hypothetical protein [Paenibacillus chitinolyticus]|uniref:hypothetical protein n=1 Tax=Paenibacillus chitinolyticus TaxID=79263 RepID=UPI00295F38CF|nr:hypothetical protein [Paenibacillus chitinolyticus]
MDEHRRHAAPALCQELRAPGAAPYREQEALDQFKLTKGFCLWKLIFLRWSSD